MDLVKTVVQECKKNGMKVWIEGDCGYPDGFAGGMISRDYPQLGMQGIIADAHCTVAAGQTLDIPLPADTLGILANPRGECGRRGRGRAGRADRMPLPADGNFKYTAPRRGGGEMMVQLPNAEVRYSVTPASRSPFRCPLARRASSSAADVRVARRRGWTRRGVGGTGGQVARWCRCPRTDSSTGRHRPARGRGSLLSSGTLTAVRPRATTMARTAAPPRTALLADRLSGSRGHGHFIKLIHETYEKAVGDEFGKTVLGFRGDETDYTGVSPGRPSCWKPSKR